MPTLDPSVERTLLAVADALRAAGVRFCIVGALVPELLLNERPSQATNDADAVIFVRDHAAFEQVKAALTGFTRTKLPCRLQHDEGGLVDLLPYSETLAPDGILRLPPDYVFNMAGFDRVAEAALDVQLQGGQVVPVVPVPLHVLLKLVAFTDRKLSKDVEGVLHCLRYYAEDDDRRFGLEHGNELVPWEYGTAYLAGTDGMRFLTERLRATVGPLLDRLVPTDDSDDEDDVSVRETTDVEYLRWYRRGLGI